MKSTANIKGHPIHPILVGFPIAFFVGSLLFDVLAIVCNKGAFWDTGQYLGIAGICAGLLAAIPGAIDYFFTVPPQSSGKKRATKHALVNVTVVVIFLIAAIARRHADVSYKVIIVLDIIGVGLLCVGGWLGGTLVYRNQIGVDMRYADAGRWEEKRVNISKGKIEVPEAGKLKLNQMILVHAGDKRIVIGKTEDGYVAFDDHCTHKGGTLAGGAMICGTVQCPWHGSQFDVKTGKVKAGPAKKDIDTYKVTEEGGKVYLNMD